MKTVVNRADFYSALNSVLPHVGTAAQSLDWVGYDHESGFVFAVDGHTVGVAQCPTSSTQLPPDRSEWGGWYLHPSEAKDLLKFVRPSVKATLEHEVHILVVEQELHVAIYSPFVPGEGDDQDTGGEMLCSEVYTLREPGTAFHHVWNLIQKVSDRRDESYRLVFQPGMPAKFAKAQREETDQINFFPASDGASIAAVVTVGEHFVGAILGIAYDFFQENPLVGWNLEKRRAA